MKAALDLRSFRPSLLRPLAAVLLILAALWIAWGGWQLHAANRLNEHTDTARRQVANQLRPTLKVLLDRCDGLKGNIALISAIHRNDLEAAKEIIVQTLSGAEAVQLLPADLAAAYADPVSFGYGKLGVLENALQEGRAELAVVKDEGKPRLALAVPVIEQGQVLKLVYVRQSLAPLLAKVKDTAPAGAYLALRQGHYNVIESGKKETLQFEAEVDAETLGDTPLRVVAAAPAVAAGLFDLQGLGEFAMAVLLGLLGAAIALWPRLRNRAAAAPAVAAATGDETMTLDEMQKAGKIASPEPSQDAARISAVVPAVAPKATLDRSIFRTYDIRGIVGQTLDTDITRLIGQAIGTVMHERGQRTVVVGRDGRLSSASLSEALIDGLRKAGREIIDIGEVPTPLAYFGSFQLRTGCCVSITGSHNPPDYNGFKIVIDGETLSGEAILNLYARIAENRLHRADPLGQVSTRDIKGDYIQRIAGDIQIERKLKVVIDCGSGVAGAIAPDLLHAIGADVEPLFCEVDGTFPHHHPDPSDPDNLQDLIRVVQRVGADIGLALDGDGDRLGVVTRNGEIVYPDRVLMLFAADVLERNPGACVIYDVKCTGHLATHILRHGGSPLMWKTGHSLIKAKMKETEAELAGEMSGHFFFRERWYGFDDGIYAAARLLEILASSPNDPDAVFAILPKSVSTPELKIPVEEGRQYGFIDDFLASAKFDGARLTTIDGLRADWPDGWGLVRASNTTPTLVLRFDAKDGEALSRIQSAFREQLLAVDPELELPF